MPVPSYQKLMLPVLKAVAAGASKPADIRASVAATLGLTDDEVSEPLPSGSQPVFTNRVSWALVYLGKAQAVTKPAPGTYAPTQRGAELLASGPIEITSQDLKQYPDFGAWLSQRGSNTARAAAMTGSPLSDEGATEEDQDPNEAIEAAVRVLQADLQADLLDRLVNVSPAQFEELVTRLLSRVIRGDNRADRARVVGRPGDGGIDVLIHRDNLDLDVVFAQAKRYAPGNSVGSPDLQRFAGSLMQRGATRGVFVTSSTFTPNAEEFARTIQPRISLIDGEQMTRLMIEHDVGVRVAQTYLVKKIDDDAFDDL